jgi:DNA-nicking Smr family endonuclease
VLTIERDRRLVRLLVRGVELEMGLGQLGTPMLPSGLADSELPTFSLDRVLAPPPPAPPAPKPAPAPAKPQPAPEGERPTPVPLIPLVSARPSAPAAALASESSPAGAQPAPARRVIGTLPPALEAALAGMLTRQAPVRSPADTMQQQTAPGATSSAPPEMGGPPAPKPRPGKRQGKRRQQWSDDDFLKSSIPKPVTARRATPGFNQPTATTVAASGAELKKPGKADADDDEAPIVTYGLKRAQAAAPEITLDLHGMRVEEALVAVDRHIDDALMNDYPYVRLMHGFGTGALRRSIREHLRHHPAIRRLTGAPPSEGGGGVTIVEFR